MMGKTWPLTFFLLFILASACSSTSSRQEQKGRPLWLTDVEKGCSEAWLCAVGEGETLTQAQIRGRSELAKIFEVRVTGETRSRQETFEEGQISGENFRAQSESYFSRDLREATDQVLQGARMRKHEVEGSAHYALMGLKKSLVRQKYDSLLQTVDEKIRQNFEKRNRYGLVEASRLWPKRRAIAQKLEIVAMASVPPIPWGEIQRELDSLEKKVIVFNLQTDKISAKESQLGEFIEKELQRLRFKVFRDKSSAEDADYELVTSFRAKRVHFNVKGFKRYRFSLVFSAKDLKDGGRVGSLEVSTEENGRDFQQALNKINDKWKSYIEDNIHRLNMN